MALDIRGGDLTTAFKIATEAPRALLEALAKR
jgi:hypothetical protein